MHAAHQPGWCCHFSARRRALLRRGQLGHDTVEKRRRSVVGRAVVELACVGWSEGIRKGPRVLARVSIASQNMPTTSSARGSPTHIMWFDELSQAPTERRLDESLLPLSARTAETR